MSIFQSFPSLNGLNKLSKKFGKDNMGLYRDDGLSAFKNHNDHQNGKVRKKMVDLFKQPHLNLEIKFNLKIADDLDITFDLTTGLLNHTVRPAMFPDMLMQNQITRHLYRKKYRNLFQNVLRRILVMNRFSMLLHCFITTF